MWDGSGFQSRGMLHFRVIAKKPIFNAVFHYTVIQVNISKIQVNLSIVNKEINFVAHLTPKASQFTNELQGPTQWCSETPQKMSAPIFDCSRLATGLFFCRMLKIICN